MRIRDLSQAYVNGMPHAQTIPAPCFEQVKLAERDGYSVTQPSVATHIGTHIDVPSHLIEGGETVEGIPPETLVGSALVVSIDKEPDEEITAEDLEDAVGGRRANAFLIRTGWGAKFGDEDYAHHPHLSNRKPRVSLDFLRARSAGLKPATF